MEEIVKWTESRFDYLAAQQWPAAGGPNKKHRMPAKQQPKKRKKKKKQGAGNDGEDEEEEEDEEDSTVGVKSCFFLDPNGGPGYVYPVQRFSYYKEDMLDALESAPSMTKKRENEKLLELVQGYANVDEVDWEKVSKEMTALCKAPRTPMNCFSAYFNNLDPSINKGKWTVEEEKKLVELATVHREHDWIVIAEKLGTNRTPFQCLKHYQQALNTKMTTVTDWTLEEERLLKEAVAMHGTSNNWQSVADHIPGRTANQCMAKWRRSSAAHEGSVVDGRWIEEEERRLFLSAVAFEIPTMDECKKPQSEIDRFIQTYVKGGAGAAAGAAAGVGAAAGAEEEGGNGGAEAGGKKRQRKYLKGLAPADSQGAPVIAWTKVAEMVPGRDDSRCREKWTTSLDPSINLEPWTADEDALLLALVDQLGVGNWTAISQYLLGRNDGQCAARWAKLAKSKGSGAEVAARKKECKKRRTAMPPALGRVEVSTLQPSSSDFVEVLSISTS